MKWEDLIKKDIGDLLFYRKSVGDRYYKCVVSEIISSHLNVVRVVYISNLESKYSHRIQRNSCKLSRIFDPHKVSNDIPNVPINSNAVDRGYALIIADWLDQCGQDVAAELIRHEWGEIDGTNT